VVSHPSTDEVAKPGLLTLDRLRDLLVLLHHHALFSQCFMCGRYRLACYQNNPYIIRSILATDQYSSEGLSAFESPRMHCSSQTPRG
jgi:hypothetical protein